MRGLFINFEGIDKCGKGTQIELLKQKMIKFGYPCSVSSEPTEDSEVGKYIWRVLRKEISAPSALKLQLKYSEDRKSHVENIIVPILKKGIHCLEDRYFFSTFAYGVAFGVDYQLLKNANLFLVPDITFYIQISAQEAIRRLQVEKSKSEYFEKQEFLEKVKTAYEQIFSNEPNICTINGERSRQEIHQDIWEIVKKQLENWS